ncbi:MAG: branched-chain amino acid transport system permease protein [Gaiellaceae bacterium]|nr:branched-chain amino acid transport system permease protein [Gaiellaceae bacterium]
MNLTLQVVLSGLAAGGLYGLLAIGYSMLYRLTGIVHFALGDLVGLAVFATLLVSVGLDPATHQTGGARFALGVVVGIAVTVALGVGTYFLAVHLYLVRGSTIGWIGATIAVAFAIRAVLGAIFTQPAYAVPDPFRIGRLGRDGVVSIGGASFQVRSLVVFAVALALAGLVAWAVERTRFGRGLEAISSDVEAARLVGVPVDRFVGVAFGAAGAIAAVAALVAAPGAPFSVDTGTLLGLKGLVAAVAVGFASPWRSFAAGIVLGVLETGIANTSALGPAYRDVLPLAAVVILLALRRRTDVVEAEA